MPARFRVHFKTDAFGFKINATVGRNNSWLGPCDRLAVRRPEPARRAAAFTRLVLLMSLGYVRWEKAFLFQSDRRKNFFFLPKTASTSASITW